jgi:orotidine-5'-phosphate decarboxylase
MAGVRAIPIVALDVADTTSALSLVTVLDRQCGFYKIGSQLFTTAGPPVVAAVRERGTEVFLDLKFHDIPNTVESAARSAALLGVSLLTVHASGGKRMVAAAVAGVAGTRCEVLAVTVLTSLGAGDLAATWGRSGVSVEDEVLRLGAMAVEAGAHGLVCAGTEVAALRRALGPGVLLVVPGVRLSGDAASDQARVITPAAAAAAGASHIVLGRTVTAADDPRVAMRRVIAEMG